MLLVLDVSNSSTKFGLYDGQRLAGNWRIDSELRQTADEYGLLITGLMRHHGVDPKQVSAAIMCNVVPPLIASALLGRLGSAAITGGPAAAAGIATALKAPMKATMTKNARTV